MKKHSVKIDFAGKDLVLETGELANLASGSVIAKYGDTVVLATAVMGKERPDLGYFPLTVEYVERLYAGGVIKGSRWVKREGRPSDDSILSARLIDRSIRPLFSKDFKREVQVIVTILSVDGENDPDVISICAVSAALAISDIPWGGPVGGVRVGLVGSDKEEKKFVVNPVNEDRQVSDLDLVVTATNDAILMVEAGAKQVSEAKMLEALEVGYGGTKKIVKLIGELVKKAGKEKVEYEAKELNKDLVKKIEKLAIDKIQDLVAKAARKEVSEYSFDALKDEVAAEFEADEVPKSEIFEIVDYLAKENTREMILKKGVRPDGRKPDEIREISAKVGLLPRTHGSAMFQRGQTQGLTIVTLGTPSLEQLIESAEGEERKRYIHHYNMPPYSVGETGRTGWPKRREIGHGALAERALLEVIPSKKDFPYTIRVVSEIMASNGSTSMAAVCGSTLALMDAGVPILAPVSGIAMGLVVGKTGEGGELKDKDYVILSDIVGHEDYYGDMDFKVAGTSEGVTSLQLDVKISGLTLEIFKKAFSRAKEGRLFILKKMLEVVLKPREKVSSYAPKIKVLCIDKEKIGDIIGPGGRMIRQIIAETGAEVGVEDDGSVTISSTDEKGLEKAVEWIEGITMEFTPGDEFLGEVKRIEPFGAFVEIVPGRDGLVHVSKMSAGYVSDPNQVVKLGDKVRVKLTEVDDLGRLNLTMILDEKQAEDKIKQERGGRPQRDGGFQRERRPQRDRRPKEFGKSRFGQGKRRRG